MKDDLDENEKQKMHRLVERARGQKYKLNRESDDGCVFHYCKSIFKLKYIHADHR